MKLSLGSWRGVGGRVLGEKEKDYSRMLQYKNLGLNLGGNNFSFSFVPFPFCLRMGKGS